MRRLLVLAPLLLGYAAPARAALGDLDLTVRTGTGGSPLHGLLQADLAIGLHPQLALEASVGGEYDGAGRALAAAGVRWALDLLQWVPELAVNAGAAIGADTEARVLARAGLWYYVRLNVAIGASGGPEWRPSGWRGGGTFGVRWWLNP